jgi:hypothetical protein
LRGATRLLRGVAFGLVLKTCGKPVTSTRTPGSLGMCQKDVKLAEQRERFVSTRLRPPVLDGAGLYSRPLPMSSKYVCMRRDIPSRYSGPQKLFVNSKINVTKQNTRCLPQPRPTLNGQPSRSCRLKDFHLLLLELTSNHIGNSPCSSAGSFSLGLLILATSST